MIASSSDSLLSLLYFYKEMGITTMVDSTPTSWYRPHIQPRPSASEYPSMPDLSFTSIDSLISHLSHNSICALQKTDPHCFIGTGAIPARVVFVAQAPTADDVRSQHPFSGSLGSLLDAMLLSIGLDKTSCYLTYSVFWRPPGQRSPTDTELLACRPYLLNIIALARPLYVVALGASATFALLGTQSKHMNAQESPWHSLSVSDSHTTQVLPSLDLEDLLRTPLKKRRAFADLLVLHDALLTAGKG